MSKFNFRYEPAVIKGIIGTLAAGALIWGFDFTETSERLQQTADLVGTLITLLTALWIRQTVTAPGNTVEYVDKNGVVKAGEANELVETGAPVRYAGDAYLDEHLADDESDDGYDPRHL